MLDTAVTDGIGCETEDNSEKITCAIVVLFSRSHKMKGRPRVSRVDLYRCATARMPETAELTEIRPDYKDEL